MTKCISTSSLKRSLKNILALPTIILKSKVFCISMQRTGTTSVGNFLEDHGFRVARVGDSNYYNWSYLWNIGDFDSIFNSIAFKSYNAFEDHPWWYPDFYKIIHQKYPTGKFILFTRNSTDWFESMLSLAGGKTPGHTRVHCKVYRRMSEFHEKIDNDNTFDSDWERRGSSEGLLRMEGKREHYIKIFEEYNREVIEYFEEFSPRNLFTSKLEDDNKWRNLGDFLGIDVKREYNMHANKRKILVNAVPYSVDDVT